MAIRYFFRLSESFVSAEELEHAPQSGAELDWFESGSFREWEIPANCPPDLHWHVGAGMAANDDYSTDSAVSVILRRDEPEAEPIQVGTIFPLENLAACLRDADPRVRLDFLRQMAEVIRPYSEKAADELETIGRY